MMQRRPNPTELRSMDSYIQILCRFQKSKGSKGMIFLVNGCDGGGFFPLLFWNLHKIWI